jgi:REP element-mobilizing transposase RayT
VHVTVRLLDGLPSLRTKSAFRVVRDCIRDSHKDGFSVVEFSVMRNHLHLIVEAMDAQALAKGMQGLKVRLARRLNRSWGRRGTVFSERYHATILTTPRQVRSALAYVLCNARRHAWQHGRHVLASRWIDPYSSADTFAGWSERFARAGPLDDVVRGPQSWLLRKGWRRHGLVGIAEIPAR